MIEALPAGAALIRTATAIGERVLAARADAGLAAVQLQALRLSTASPTMGDLVQRLGLPKSTATSVVDQLVASGLAERRTDTADRRRQVLSPTPRGLDVLHDFDAAVQRNVAALLEVIPADRRLLLSELLARIPDAGKPIPLA